MGWHARLNSFALSYAHVISNSAGLIGAVQLDSVTASFRQQITKALGASLGGAYAQNNVLGSGLIKNNGHSLSGSAGLQQQLGQHLAIYLGYDRIHQSYENVQVISQTPDTNRESISISYQFSRPLGR